MNQQAYMPPLIRQGHELEMPARPGWVRFTLLLGVLLIWLPWPEGGQAAVPDFLLMLLLYWVARAPAYVGMGSAVALGLLTDIDHGALLGVSVLTYSLAVYAVLRLRTRLAHFAWWGRAVHIAPILLLANALGLWVPYWLGVAGNPWYLLGGILAAALWPFMALGLDRTGHVPHTRLGASVPGPLGSRR